MFLLSMNNIFNKITFSVLGFCFAKTYSIKPYVVCCMLYAVCCFRCTNV